MRASMWALLVVTNIGGWPTQAGAHEMRPSMLEILPREQGRYDVRFRVAYARGAPMALTAQLPAHCQQIISPMAVDTPPIRTVRWRINCGVSGLKGRVSVTGLADTGTEVIVKALDSIHVLRASSPYVELSVSNAMERGSVVATFTTYLAIGVEHIGLGPDHLVFILGLVLMVGFRWRRLLATVTAFTAAHSFTLILVTLDAITVPSRAVEAVIALSIVVLAIELSRLDGPRQTPWLFAGGCGLLHGFGFAGVLGDVGLPVGARLTALLGFNLGVEVGQLIFVLLILAIGTMARRRRLVRARVGVVYTIGGLGAFWFWQRAVPIVKEWMV
ncbi:MAG: HupE/UreJ family protein [Myxococcota bacterium]|nr:HupE/UreJ family protein [Myxococcota bacterium]